jgi:hypothetical protein
MCSTSSDKLKRVQGYVMVGTDKKYEAIALTCRGGPHGCDTLKNHHFLDNRLTDGNESVSITRRPRFSSSNIRGSNFCKRMSGHQNINVAGRM